MGHDRFDRLLGRLRESVLFSEDFPRRRRLSHAEWAEVGEEEGGRLHEPGLIAISRVTNAWELADIIGQLGKTKHRATVPEKTT
jgi:hypothetical protein